MVELLLVLFLFLSVTTKKEEATASPASGWLKLDVVSF
jgi:hypothetical protein